MVNSEIFYIVLLLSSLLEKHYNRGLKDCMFYLRRQNESLANRTCRSGLNTFFNFLKLKNVWHFLIARIVQLCRKSYCD